MGRGEGKAGMKEEVGAGEGMAGLYLWVTKG